MISKKPPQYPSKNNKYIFIHLNLLIIAIILTSCTPPRDYLLRKSKSIGIDKLYIRVLIKKADRRILISSRSRLRITDIRSRVIKYDGKGREISLHPEDVVKPLLIESWEKPLRIDKKYYRGMIELHNILGKIYVINILSINEYLYGVVPSEIPHSWHLEAIKAQAIAARTYTYYHIVNKNKSLYDLDSTTNFQVYKGIAAECERTNNAIDKTSGKIAICNNKPIIAFFHSTCGGKTIDDRYVWNGDDKPYLKGVKCSYCKDSPCFAWKESLTLYEISRCLKKKYRLIGRIKGVTFRKKNSRVASVIIQHKNGVLKISGNEFRLLFPQKRIKSMFFRAIKTRDGLILHGNGWGHGVGMCQWGAKGMAEKGANYRDILKYYYKRIKIIDTHRAKYAKI